jgi:hypothetical protein
MFKSVRRVVVPSIGQPWNWNPGGKIKPTGIWYFFVQPWAGYFYWLSYFLLLDCGREITSLFSCCAALGKTLLIDLYHGNDRGAGDDVASDRWSMKIFGVFWKDNFLCFRVHVYAARLYTISMWLFIKQDTQWLGWSASWPFQLIGKHLMGLALCVQDRPNHYESRYIQSPSHHNIHLASPQLTLMILTEFHKICTAGAYNGIWSLSLSY